MAGAAVFKDWFKQRRKALDVTQEDLARQVGCSVATIPGSASTPHCRCGPA